MSAIGEGPIADLKRDDQAIRRHMEDNNSEKFVRTQVYNVANRISGTKETTVSRCFIH